MNLQGALQSLNPRNWDPRQGQTLLVAKLIKTDDIKTNNKKTELCKRFAEVIINAGLVATGTASALLEAGKFTVSAPAWAVGQPILWLISGKAQKIWGMPKALEYGTTYLPTKASLCETWKRVVNQALGALSSLITTLRQVGGWANPTPGNIRAQIITYKTVDSDNETIQAAAQAIQKQIKAEKKAEKKPEKEKVEKEAEEEVKSEEDADKARDSKSNEEKVKKDEGKKPPTVKMSREGDQNKSENTGKCTIS